jgi:hypothetical protein
MPKLITQLTGNQCKHAKPKAKPYNLPDGGGLNLIITPISGVYQGATVRVSRDLNGTDSALHAAKLEAQPKDVTKQVDGLNGDQIGD